MNIRNSFFVKICGEKNIVVPRNSAFDELIPNFETTNLRTFYIKLSLFIHVSTVNVNNNIQFCGEIPIFRSFKNPEIVGTYKT